MLSRKYLFLFALKALIFSTFIFSIYTKLLVYTDFLFFISDTFKISETISILGSATLLAIEFYVAIGVFLFSDRRFYYIITYSLILILTGLAAYLYTLSSVENCFCYGGFLELTPSETIAKNIILIIISGAIHKIENINSGEFFSEEKLSFPIVIMTFIFLLDKPIDYFSAPVQFISISEAYENQNEIQFIDSRDITTFNLYHIKNAIHLPYSYQISTELNQKIALLKNYDFIVTYCDRDVCSLAKGLAREIQKKYPKKKVFYLKGGLEKWLEHRHQFLH